MIFDDDVDDVMTRFHSDDDLGEQMAITTFSLVYQTNVDFRQQN